MIDRRSLVRRDVNVGKISEYLTTDPIRHDEYLMLEMNPNILSFGYLET